MKCPKCGKDIDQICMYCSSSNEVTDFCDKKEKYYDRKLRLFLLICILAGVVSIAIMCYSYFNR